MQTGTNFENITLHFGDKDAAAFHRFKGFTSAVVTDEKLSSALSESLAQSLEQGTSLAQWRKEADKIFDKQGVTKLNSFQAELIHRNESAMAFGAGQFAQLQRNKETFPYYSVSTRKDHRVRDSHRALEGKVFRSDDSQYFPPLGINCRCAAKLITKRQAEKQGITGPDTITPEMRANLQNVEFVGDKVGNYADWLNVKIKEMPEAYKALIIEKLAEIEATLTLTPIEKIQAAEAEIVVNDFETMIIFDKSGNRLTFIIGEEASVNLDKDTRALLKNAVWTHNHPSPKGKNLDISFSDADVLVLKYYKSDGARAVTTKSTYTIELTDSGKLVPYGKFKGRITGILNQLLKKIQQEVYDGKLTADEGNELIYHELWVQFQGKTTWVKYTKQSNIGAL
ncbi:MAG: minor capsid protein [Chlorobiaceae bacterium]